MATVIDALDRVSGAPLATAVHLYPSEPEAALQRYAALGARRVLLVTGDVDGVFGLERLQAGRPWLQIVAAVVAPSAGTVEWIRYSVGALSGTLQASGLHSFYPRLRVLDRRPVEAVTLQSLLDPLQLSGDGRQQANLLVLEAPGIEERLLSSLTPETLEGFAWVLWRGARHGLYQDAETSETSVRLLEDHCFRQVDLAQAAEPLWPVTLMRYDHGVGERRVLLAQLQALQNRAAALESQRDELLARSEQQQAQLAALAHAKAAAEASSVALGSTLEAAASASSEAARLKQEQSLRIQELERRLAHACAERDEQAHWHTENAKWAKSLNAENERLKRERDTVVEDREAVRRELNELRGRHENLERQLSDQAVRQQRLDAEVIKAEAQLQLIRDVLIREKNF